MAHPYYDYTNYYMAIIIFNTIALFTWLFSAKIFKRQKRQIIKIKNHMDTISSILQTIRKNIPKIEEIPDSMMDPEVMERKNEILFMADELEKKLNELDTLPVSQETLNKYSELKRECQLLEQKFNEFEREIEKRGSIKTNVKIKKIDKNDMTIVYEHKKKMKKEKFDKIISTIPPESFLKIISKPSEKIRKEFKKIKYLSCVCACIGLNYNPTKYYWLNMLDPNKPFVAVFNYTQLFEDLAPEGKSVMYLVTYLRKKNGLWRMNEKRIFNLYAKYLEKIFPGISKKIEWYRITKFAHAEAIFNLNFKNPPVSDGNIYFAGIYRIFPKIRNMASALESGLEAANALLRASR